MANINSSNSSELDDQYACGFTNQTEKSTASVSPFINSNDALTILASSISVTNQETEYSPEYSQALKIIKESKVLTLENRELLIRDESYVSKSGAAKVRKIAKALQIVEEVDKE